jgi:outer membrane protein assembly factor BamB
MKLILPLLTLVLMTSCLGLQKVERPQKVFNLKWAKNLDPNYEAGNLPIGLTSPLIHDDILYQGNLDGRMVAYNVADGRVVWETDEKQPLSSTPQIHQELLIYGSQMGRVFARHYLTGKLTYSIDLKAPVESAPTFFKGRMFFHLRNHQLVVLDALTGKIIWTYKRAVPYTTTLQGVSRPLPYKNNIIVGFADGYVGSLSIDDGQLKWEERITTATKFVDVDINPVLFNNKLYIASFAGDLKVLDPTNGTLLRSLGVTAGHTPVVYAGNMYVPTLFGEVIVLDGQSNIQKRVRVSEDSLVSIGQWKNRIVVSTSTGKVIAVDTKTSRVSGSFNLGNQYSTVFGDLEAMGEYLAVYSSRNRLYLFQ